ncbi:energy transducer TonB [soil metagenome]
MKSEVTIPKEWDDIVFENRNKEYGAYLIRKLYSRNVLVSLGITLLTVVFVIAYPAIAKMIRDANPEPVKEVIHSTVNLDQPPPIMPNQPPPPKVEVPPPVKTIIKFLPPKVVDKEPEVEEEMPTIEEIKVVDTGPETQEGTGDVVFTEPVKEAAGEDPNQIFLVVEQPPEFPGGNQALMTFIAKNMRYPAQARRMQIEGQVYVSFVVDADGRINDIQVIKGIGAGCDEEAKRVVGLLPPWKPGKQRGRPVRVKFTLPLKFKLS